MGGAHCLRLRDSPFILNSRRQRGRRMERRGAGRAGARAAGARAGARAAWAPGWRAPRGGERACVCVRVRGRPAFSVTGATKKGRVRAREGGAAAAAAAEGAAPPAGPFPRARAHPER